MMSADGFAAERWDRIDQQGLRGTAGHALATLGSGEGIAVGDAEGVSLWRDGRKERSALEGIRDLAFDPAGQLWIATESGLFLWAAGDRPKQQTLAGGEAANRIMQVIADRDLLWAATGAGLFVSHRGGPFRSWAIDGTATGVRLVARRSNETRRIEGQRAGPSQLDVWVYSERGLTSIRGRLSDRGVQIVESTPLILPRARREEAPVDLLLNPSGDRLILVYPDQIAWRSVRPPGSMGRDPAAWKIERPVMPPGARIRRVTWANQSVWIATDRGLLRGDGIGQPLQRASSPLGTAECQDLATASASALIVLCREGLFERGTTIESLGVSAEGTPALTRRPAVLGSRVFALPPMPPVAAIRSRALASLGLDMERAAKMRRKLARRALWPKLALGAGVDFDRDEDWDADQSIVSGQRRGVVDRGHDRSDGYGASIELEWDLGDWAYPEDTVDLSRELRQVLSLRDDVSDEIHQLYFERESIRRDLAEATALAPPEVTRLRLRAGEIEAGLDAWTDGWLSDWKQNSHAMPQAD